MSKLTCPYKNIFEKESQRTNFLLGAIVSVAIFGFFTLAITVSGFALDSIRFKAETYQTLVDKVYDQNMKIEALTREIKKQR